MLSQELQQSLTLSQFQIQALNMLSLDGAALDQLLQSEEYENPVFDLDKVEPIAYQPYTRPVSDENAKSAIDWAVQSTDELPEYLLSQLPSENVTKEERHIFRQMVDFLEPGTGLLPESVQEVAELLDAPLYTVEKCLSWMHCMEPAGVGAATVSESLVLQTYHRGIHDQNLYTILFDYLDDIAAHRYRHIMKALNLSMQQVEQYAQQIRSLEPYPTAAFGANNTPLYIVPDLYFEPDEDGHWQVRVRDRWSKDIPYGELYHMKVSRADPELQAYLRERRQHAGQIVQCVEKRRSTLLLLGQCALETQLDFLAHGEPLHTLTREDLAERTGLNASTVSRAFKDKYVQTPQKIYPFSFFLSKSSGKSHQSDSSSRSEALVALSALIRTEDPSAPFSDEQLVNRLSQQGVQISRRTVAKYRMLLGIPGAYERKR